MKYAALFLAAFLFVPAAQAQVKDSYYFMRDDGVQSPEEVMEEAEYVFQACDTNVFQRDYFDCACIAGTFLQARDKYGSVAPQEEIISDILNGRNARCANPTGIAGKLYQNCMDTSAVTREYNKDNEEFCTCVGNTTARRFTARPALNSSYIARLESRALVDCQQRDDNNNPTRGYN